MKWIAALCALCIALLAVTGYVYLRRSPQVAPPPAAPDSATRTPDALQGRAAVLHEARRSCDPARIDAFLAEQERMVADSPSDAVALRLHAEALLERILLRTQRLGLKVGEPLYAEVPPATAADIELALRQLERARAAGDDSAENWRLQAALIGNRIVGFGSALQWNGKIESALAAASKRDTNHPPLHVTLGLRKLLAPRLLGHDPEQALQHLEFAAAAMPDDERPRVFAAMAAFLLQKRQQAILLLEKAVTINPKNVFANAVLQRLRRGEDDPFARDVPEK